MTLIRIRLYVLTMLFILLPAVSFAQTVLTLNTAMNPPLSTSFDYILTEAFRRLGIEVVIQELPGERALKNANKGIDDGDAARIFEISQTYTNLIRVPEPIIEVQIVGFSLDGDITIKDWASLQPYNVSIVRGYRILEDNIVGTRSLTKVENITELLTLVHKKRTDVAVINRMEGMAEIQKLGFKSIKILEPPLDRRALYPHLHKKHQALVPKLATVLRDMKRDGTYQKLLDKAMKEYFKQGS